VISLPFRLLGLVIFFLTNFFSFLTICFLGKMKCNLIFFLLFFHKKILGGNFHKFFDLTKLKKIKIGLEFLCNEVYFYYLS